MKPNQGAAKLVYDPKMPTKRVSEDELARVIPSSFYSDRPLKDRVAKLVEIWRQAVLTNGALQEQVETLKRERDEARAQVETLTVIRDQIEKLTRERDSLVARLNRADAAEAELERRRG